MKYSTGNRGLPAGNPIANIFVVIAGALIIAVSVVLGLVAFVVLGSIVAIFAAVVGLRLWWFKRKLARQGTGPSSQAEPASTSLIEGEFRVVEKNGDDASRP